MRGSWVMVMVMMMMVMMMMMMMMILLVQFFVVDRVSAGLLTASQAVQLIDLEASIQRLAAVITAGLEITVHTEDSGTPTLIFDVTELRQCTAGAHDIYADCSDGTVVAPVQQNWFVQNQNAVIGVSVTVVVVYTVITFL